jgi:carbamoyl-phosphate synthase / aspartate carbamoyltransferase / dihydroorotase
MAIVRLPGLTDPHVHLREPGATHKEDFESGSRAALAGGFTTVLAMPNTNPPLIDSESLALAEAGAARSRCDYGIYLGASGTNPPYTAFLADRVCGMKLYLDATFGSLHLKDLAILRDHFAMFPKDRPIVCHAEERTVAAVLMVAQLERRTVHIAHVSRRAEIELIRDAKERGIDVTCEVAPHHLFLTVNDFAKLGRGRCEVRPSLATPDDQEALWSNWETIDCIATDHAPHLLKEKDSLNPPPGFPGLETSLALMLIAVHAERVTLDEVIRRMDTNPRRIFNLPEQPDTTIEVDTDLRWTVRGEETHTRCQWSPFEGWTLRGRVIRTVLRGEEVYAHGTFPDSYFAGRNVAPAYREAYKEAQREKITTEPYDKDQTQRSKKGSDR